MGTALALAVIVGIVLGAAMVHWSGKWPDRVLSVLALLFYSTPGFWIGLLAIVLFSVRLGWLPSGGNVTTIGASLHGWAWFVDVGRHHVLLPAVTLAAFFVWRSTRGWCARRCSKCSAGISCAPPTRRACIRPA
ncbi:MAG: Glutathione transport system permease protein GsiC [Burkholderia gladioli]|nr:MAG: Glutathione transport system permease protein GsiC [Burkholderia gladioli]